MTEFGMIDKAEEPNLRQCRDTEVAALQAAGLPVVRWDLGPPPVAQQVTAVLQRLQQAIASGEGQPVVLVGTWALQRINTADWMPSPIS